MRTKDILVVVGASVVSAAAASAATWIYANKKIAADYDERLDKEVKQSVDFICSTMANIVVSDEDPDVVQDELEAESAKVEVEIVEEEELDEQEPLEDVGGERIFPQREGMTLDELKAKSHKTRYDKILTEEEYKEESEPEPEVDNGGWDPVSDGISVISRDIFMENASDFDQTTMTYFQDGGVIDLDSELVIDHELLIGSGKPPFGQMSEDENIVYIRNKNIQVEYEVIQDPGNASDFLAHSLAGLYNFEHTHSRP